MPTLPQFAAGERTKVQPAIDSGVLKYPAYVFIRDENKLAFVDRDNTMHTIIGDNKKQVIRVDTLPSVSDADAETLYICSGVVYLLDNGELKPVFQDNTDSLTQINNSISELYTKVETLEQGQSAIAFSTKNAFPEVGTGNLLYVATDEPAIYIWNSELQEYTPMNGNETNVQWIEL